MKGNRFYLLPRDRVLQMVGGTKQLGVVTHLQNKLARVMWERRRKGEWVRTCDLEWVRPA